VKPAPDICLSIHDLLPAYAIGALDEHETHFVEANLGECGHLLPELADYDRAAAAIRSAAPPVVPPPALKNRLMAEAHELLPAPAKPEKVIAIPTWLAWSLSAAAAILIGTVAVLGTLLSQSRNDVSTAETAQRHLAYYLAAGGTVTQLAATSVSPDYPNTAQGVVVTAPGMPAMIVVTGCLPTNDNRSYRVWYAHGSDRTGMGELVIDNHGDGWMELGSPDLLANVTMVGVTMVWGDEKGDWLMGPMPDTQTTASAISSVE
jgi:hypothetical protein